MVVKDTLAPIIADGFVRVCCKSIMKLFTEVKPTMLWCDDKMVN